LSQPAASPLPDRAARRRIALPQRGVEIAIQDWGGKGPLALLHHANGFCASMWAEVAAELCRDYRVVAMDARGQGDSSLPPEGTAIEGFTWPALRDDLIAVADTLLAETGAEQVALGLGHSFGGTLTLAAECARPGLFERIVLVDPVILPPMTPEERKARAGEVGLADRARKRRDTWPSREAAREHFAARELFANFTKTAYGLYIDEALRELPDGQVTLKCPGAVEANVFDSGHTLDIFEHAPRAKAPARLLWAKGGNFPRAGYEALVSGMQQASIEDLDAGHLAPMERPDRVVEAVRRFTR
jgi:pimeloyl-ACP methyl ester carboxylesterase